MAELTKEFFEENLKDLATKKDLGGLASKEDLRAQTEELKEYSRQQTEELARIVKEGFDGVDKQLAGIVTMLDVR